MNRKFALDGSILLRRFQLIYLSSLLQDLQFLDGQKLGKHITIIVALIHPETNNETRLELFDLKLAL